MSASQALNYFKQDLILLSGRKLSYKDIDQNVWQQEGNIRHQNLYDFTLDIPEM